MKFLKMRILTMKKSPCQGKACDQCGIAICRACPWTQGVTKCCVCLPWRLALALLVLRCRVLHFRVMSLIRSLSVSVNFRSRWVLSWPPLVVRMGVALGGPARRRAATWGGSAPHAAHWRSRRRRSPWWRVGALSETEKECPPPIGESPDISRHTVPALVAMVGCVAFLSAGSSGSADFRHAAA